MASLFGLIKRNYTAFNPPASESKINPIKFGILGAANIAPIALITPASNHPETIVYAVAARDKSRAENYAKKYKIGKVYYGPGGYQDLLNDPEVDAVYNPLPNGLHYEWTMKALAAGKHVLLEKPSSDTAEETRAMFDYAEKKGLVLLEAFHYRFHPTTARVKAILDSGELGPIKNLIGTLAVPAGLFIKKGDIRLNYSLGGGAMMDMGCYPLSFIRLLAGEPQSVITAVTTVHTSSQPDDKVDTGTKALLALPNNVTASLHCDFALPWAFGGMVPLPDAKMRVECENGDLEILNFVGPTFYHSIKVRVKDSNGKYKKERLEKAYTFKDGSKGEEWWTTYRYQLEAFVDKLKGRAPQTWMSKEDSVENMKCIEAIYEKGGMGTRPKSQYIHSE